MLKKSASFVLASLRDSTYPKGTPRLLARCGRADGLFEHSVWSASVPTDMRTNETLARHNIFPAAYYRG
jgi:hypothetical protein